MVTAVTDTAIGDTYIWRGFQAQKKTSVDVH